MNLLIATSIFLLIDGSLQQQQQQRHQKEPSHHVSQNYHSFSSCSHSYKQQLVWAMNNVRSNHRVSALILDETSVLAVYSQELAEYSAGLRHSPPQELTYGLYGQTRAQFSPRLKVRPSDVVADMYNASRWYRWYGREPPRAALEEFGVFTQLIWYGSRYVAFGCADSARTGERYMVVGYSPAGNVVSQYAANVFPPAYVTEERRNYDRNHDRNYDQNHDNDRGGGGGGGGGGNYDRREEDPLPAVLPDRRDPVENDDVRRPDNGGGGNNADVDPNRQQVKPYE